MQLHVELLFNFGSPNAYLSHRVIPAIESRTGVRYEYVPVLLGGVFKATNNVSPAVSLQGIRNKGEYMQLETRRFIRRHGITEFRDNPGGFRIAFRIVLQHPGDEPLMRHLIRPQNRLLALAD